MTDADAEGSFRDPSCGDYLTVYIKVSDNCIEDISSLNGVDMVLIIAEPSISGISDMERIIKTSAKFGTKIAVCINKFNTNIKNSEQIERFCREQELPFICRIPFDEDAVKVINNGQTIVYLDCASGTAVKSIYNKTIELLFEESGGLGL